jgi:hypothetical protein
MAGSIHKIIYKATKLSRKYSILLKEFQFKITRQNPKWCIISAMAREEIPISARMMAETLILIIGDSIRITNFAHP